MRVVTSRVNAKSVPKRPPTTSKGRNYQTERSPTNIFPRHNFNSSTQIAPRKQRPKTSSSLDKKLAPRLYMSNNPREEEIKEEVEDSDKGIINLEQGAEPTFIVPFYQKSRRTFEKEKETV